MSSEGELDGPPIKARRLLSPELAATAVRAGILKAAKDFEAWGGLWPTDRGCENLLQVRAAEALVKELKRSNLGGLTLEEPMQSIVDLGTAKRGRRYAGISAQRRVDIAIWNKAEEIYAVVEIKRAETDGHWRGDLEKLSEIVNTYGSKANRKIRYAVFGAFISQSRPEIVDQRYRQLEIIAHKVANRYSLKAEPTLGPLCHTCDFGASGRDWTCRAASVVIRH